MGDHTEAVQVDFDPGVISLKALAELFWRSHSPTTSIRSLQYRSAIWYGDEEQRQMIDATKEAAAKQCASPIQTAVLPLQTFYRAEDYHQKFYLQRHKRLMATFDDLYPEFSHFVDATSATKLNGKVISDAGSLTPEQLNTYGVLAAEIVHAAKKEPWSTGCVS